LFKIVTFIEKSIITAIIHHIKGEITHEATISHIFDHTTIFIHIVAVIQAHSNQPIIE
jgi:hypothetical protein